MKSDNGDRMKLVLTSILVVVGFLCITWTPAYGYIIARVERVVSEPNTNPGSPLPGTQGTLNGGTADGYFGENDGGGDFSDPTPLDQPTGVIPEPATLALFGMGLAAASLFRKLRK